MDIYPCKMSIGTGIMLHEWNPHLLEDLMQCRHCRCIRYKVDKISESRNIYGGIDNGASNLLTRDFNNDVRYYRDHGRLLIYAYSNYDYYIIKNGELMAAWTVIHPICTTERNAQANRHEIPLETQEDPPESDDDFDDEESEEDAIF